jgi:phosphoribosylaminoimidazole (AIR) synthetase
MGIGMVLMVRAEHADLVMEECRKSGEQPFAVGEVVAAETLPPDQRVLLR